MMATRRGETLREFRPSASPRVNCTFGSGNGDFDSALCISEPKRAHPRPGGDQGEHLALLGPQAPAGPCRPSP